MASRVKRHCSEMTLKSSQTEGEKKKERKCWTEKYKLGIRHVKDRMPRQSEWVEWEGGIWDLVTAPWKTGAGSQGLFTEHAWPCSWMGS